MTRAEFVSRYGGIYEHSPWIAEAAFDRGLATAPYTPETVHAALRTVVDDSGRDRQLVLLRAHPDLAGKLAVAGALTADSTSEQASAGLDQCTAAEFEEFQRLNDAYKARFGFPFILAVRGLHRTDILENFRKRVGNDRDTEFAEALEQVHKIALLRLRQLG